MEIRNKTLSNDVIFKAFILSSKTKKYKTRLIHLITGISEEELLKGEYTSQELKVNNKSDKVYKTDIILSLKEYVISIEMNGQAYNGLIEKNFGYVTRIAGEQLRSSESYINTKKIIAINFDMFHMYKKEKIVYEFMMREKETGEEEHELIKSYHIDLLNVKKKWYNKVNDELTKMLMLFITEDIDNLRGGEIMNEAIEELEFLRKHKDIIGLYDKEEEERRVFNTRIQDAEQRGEAKGIALGKTEGREESILITVKNMLKAKLDDNLIISITNIDKNELNKIKKSIKV